jgi:hypothetical protein
METAMTHTAWEKVMDEIGAFQDEIRSFRVNPDPQISPGESRSELQRRYDY